MKRNSKIGLVNSLLQVKTNMDLGEFIRHHMEAGGDTTSMQAALHMATGELFDRRTVQTWIDRYTT